jgi:hypothetical protein
VTAKTPADLLDQAANLIEERGHAKDFYEDGQGRLCAVGALRVAAFGDSRYPKAGLVDTSYIQAYDLLEAEVEQIDYAFITEWNDESDASTVVATLRAAAAKARQS